MLEDTAWLALSCRGCLGPLAGAGASGWQPARGVWLCTSWSCAAKLEELLEEVSRLRGTRKGMKEIDWIISETLQLQEPKHSTMVVKCAPARFGSGNALDGEGCPGDSWLFHPKACGYGIGSAPLLLTRCRQHLPVIFE